jgi:uncharacterized MAPEG superfamily protein
MTLPLWMLLGFAAWTIFVLLIGVGVHRWFLIFQRRAELTSFPGGTIHGSPFYRRATRAHANCVENLPVFAAIVLVAAAAHVNPPHLGGLAAATLAGRIGQTSVHMLLPESNWTIAVRFSLYLVQVLAMIAMIVLIGMAASGGGMP